MTTPGGVPNLPTDALTLDNLAERLQDMTSTAMRGRAVERMPSIFNASLGGSPAADWSLFGILTQLFAGFNSAVANADPMDITGPEDLPGLLVNFIEELPIVGELVTLMKSIISGDFGVDDVLQAITDVFNTLGSMLGLSTPDFDPNIVSELFAAAVEIIDTFARNLAQDTIDTIWQAVTRLTGTDKLLEDVFDALRNIPGPNVLGTGGPADIAETIQATWDHWISGLVGTVGTGSGLADLFNIGQLVSSRATKGEWSFDILGIRGNQGLFTGFAPTSRSNLHMGTLAFNKVSGTPTAPTVPVTQSTALTAWHRVDQAMDLGTIEWTGSGVTSITDFRINIWGMDASSGDITCLHHSTNQVGLLSGSMQDNVYDLPDSLAVEAGDLIGIELHPIGAGTHNVVGDSTWRNFSHPTIVPRRWSSKRDGGTSTATPSDIADASVDYATVYVPFVAYGVTSASSVALPHSPEMRFFTTAGATTTPIPVAWCTHIDLVAVGGGGGGEGCGILWGEGGDGGSWNSTRVERGVGIPTATTTLSITVGAGGEEGAGLGGNGSPGAASTVSATGMSTFTANGGAGGSAGNAATTGKSPGNHTFADTVFVGGAAQNVLFNDGNAPGGGGAGSSIVFTQAGSGAPGAVWVIFRQLYLPAAITLTISPTGIASGEAFGTPSIGPISPASIASAEAFGTPSISMTGMIAPAGIASAESFGTPIVTVAGGTAKTATFTDGFATLDTSTKWVNDGCSVSGGQLHLPCVEGVGTYIMSIDAFDFTESHALVQVASIDTTNAYYAYLFVGDETGSLGAVMMYVAGNLFWGDGSSSVTYNATNHAWWRVRETSGTVYYDTSADGTTWNNLGSLSTSVAFGEADPTEAIVALLTFGIGDGSDTIMDNLNLAP